MPRPKLRTMLLSASAVMTLTVAGAVIHTAEASTFNVRSYGATGDGKHNDQPAIQAAINAAIAAGKGNIVYVPGGNYALDPTVNYNAQFDVKLAKQLSIVGDASTVLLNPVPTRGFFYVWASLTTKIDRIQMKHTVKLFSQVKVQSISTKDNSITVSVQGGYDDLDTQWIKAADQLLVFSDPTSGSWGDHSAACSYYAPNYASVCWPPAVTGRTKISAGTWKLSLNTAPLANYVGATAVLWNQHDDAKASAITAAVDTDMTVSNVNYYAGGSDGLFFAMFNSGNFVFSNDNLTTAPGSSDLVAGYTGSWSMNNHWNLDIENSSFTKVWDDGLNTGALYNRIYKAESSNVIDVEKTNAVYAPGDTVGIWDWTAGGQFERSRAKVVVVDCGSSAPANSCRLTLDQAVTVSKTGAASNVPADQDGIDRVIDIDAAGTLRINNSTFQVFHASGVAFKAHDVVIQNSRFYDTIGPAIDAGPNFFSSEGPSISGLQIKNNVFSNVSSSNIMIGTERTGGGYSQAFMDSKGVVISGNTFTGYGRYSRGTIGDNRYPVYLQYVTSGSVLSNSILPFDQQDHGYGSTLRIFSPAVGISNDRVVSGTGSNSPGATMKGGPISGSKD